MENNKTQERILIFSMSYYPRFVGGAEVALKEITDRISPGECEFHLVTLRYDSFLPKYEQVGNIHVHRIGFSQKKPSFKDLRSFPLRLNKILYQFLAPFVGWLLHRKIKFQKAWSMMAHSAGVPGNIFSRLTKVPLVLTLQEGDPTDQIEKQMRIFGPLFTGVFKQTTHIQVISTFLKEWAIKMGAKEEGVSIVPNAVDTRFFTPRQKFLKTDTKRIITTSRLVPKNGTDVLIRSLPMLPQNFCIDVVGDGFEREQLELLAQELGVSDRVFFHGQKNQAEIIALLKQAFVFCRPSRSEGLGNSFLEAMAVGLPIIATPIGGIRDFLFDYKIHGNQATGLFCGVDNEKSIAECIETLDKNEMIYDILVSNGIQLIHDKYTWEGVTYAMKKLL